MSSNLFFDLPREIRDKIYVYTLCSETGCLLPSRKDSNQSQYSLLPFQPWNNTVSLIDGMNPHLLSTCKKIYAEGSQIMLEQNVAAFWPEDLAAKLKIIPAYIYPNLRYIWLMVDMRHRGHLRDTAAALDILAGLTKAKGGSSTELTLGIARNGVEIYKLDGACEYGVDSHFKSEIYYNRLIDWEDWDDWNDEFTKIGKDTMIFDRYLTIFRQNREKHQNEWVGVKRKLDMWAVSLPRSLLDPYEMIRKLNEAFRGELWIGGKLCYRDGEELLRPFTSKTGNTCLAWTENLSKDEQRAAVHSLEM